MLELFQALVASGLAELSAKRLIELLVSLVLGAQGGSVHKQGEATNSQPKFPSFLRPEKFVF